MKKVVIMFVLTMVFLLAACSSSEPEHLVEVDGSLAVEAGLFVETYKETMVSAVNSGSFNMIEPYLITNTSFYHSLRHYIDELSISHVTKEIISFIVGSVYVDELDDVYVDVKEKVVIYEDNVERFIERDVQFQLALREDGSFRIVNIKDIK